MKSELFIFIKRRVIASLNSLSFFGGGRGFFCLPNIAGNKLPVLLPSTLRPCPVDEHHQHHHQPHDGLAQGAHDAECMDTNISQPQNLSHVYNRI